MRCYNVNWKGYLTSFLPIITIFFKKRMSRLPLTDNSFEIPVKISTYSPIFRYTNRKKYLTSFLPIIMSFFKKRMSWLPLWDNSFENSVGTPLWDFLKSYPIKIIATSIFWKNIIMMGKNDVKYLFRFTYRKIGE